MAARIGASLNVAIASARVSPVYFSRAVGSSLCTRGDDDNQSDERDPAEARQRAQRTPMRPHSQPRQVALPDGWVRAEVRLAAQPARHSEMLALHVESCSP
jgi:hypothetical protein